MQIEYIPLPPNKPQARFLQAATNPEWTNIFYRGGWGAGKSQAIAQLIIDLAVTIPDNRIAVVRKVRSDLPSTTYAEFMETVDPVMVEEEKTSELRVVMRTMTPGHFSIVDFRGMDKATRWGSTQYGPIIVDEATELSEEEWRFLVGRTRYNVWDPKWNWRPCRWCGQPRAHLMQDLINTNNPYVYAVEDPVTKQWVYDVHRFVAGAFNPPNFDHWMYRWAGDPTKMEPHTIDIQASSKDNWENLPIDYRARLDGLPQRIKNVYVYGNWGAMVTGEPCTPSFNPDSHTFTGFLPNRPTTIIRGWDFGYVHPAVGFFEIRDGVVYKWRELLGNRVYLPKFLKAVQRISRQFHPDTHWIDWVDYKASSQHSDKSESTSLEILRDAGITGRAKFSRPRHRAELIDGLFAGGRLYIHKSCTLSIAAYGGAWHYPEGGGDDPEKDEYYHNIADADGYGIMGELGATARDRGTRGLARERTKPRVDYGKAYKVAF